MSENYLLRIMSISSRRKVEIYRDTGVSKNIILDIAVGKIIYEFISLCNNRKGKR